MSQPGVVHDITFTLHAGEVLGISGLMGSGRSELARIFSAWIRSSVAKSCCMANRAGATAGRIRQGLAFLTEDRRAEGLCLEAAIADNMVAGHVARAGHTGRSGW